MPVRYIGVPLITKRIGVKECKGLIDKATVFLLSQAVIDEVNSNLKGFLWNQDDKANRRAKKAYYDIQRPGNHVNWSKLVWFSQNIPKHAIILWLSILGRLNTQDKVRSWGSYDVMACPLCFTKMDSHNHLFFECGYANSLWNMVKQRMRFDCDNPSWVLCKLEVKGPPSVKSKLACFGGVPTSDALTAGLEMSSLKCAWMSVLAAVRNVAKWDVSMSNSYPRVTLNHGFDALRDGSQ
nr:hypothetical protein [Tanacetum cinerariifolium]